MRKRILQKRDNLSEEEREKASAKILNRLESLVAEKKAEYIFVYVNFRSEVITMPFIESMLAKGKKVIVPFTMVAEKKLLPVIITSPQKDLSFGYCNILEPDIKIRQDPTRIIKPSLIDLAVIPGSVFDKRGGRFGYGGGFYDRFLSGEAPQALRVALAFSLQIEERINLQPHDQPMDIIISEDKIYHCQRKS